MAGVLGEREAVQSSVGAVVVKRQAKETSYDKGQSIGVQGQFIQDEEGNIVLVERRRLMPDEEDTRQAESEAAIKLFAPGRKRKND